MTRIASDHQIHLRRRQEEQLTYAESYVSEDKTLRHYANWETRTHGRIKRGEAARRLDKVQARDDETLEKRRGRLAELLAAEQMEYEREMEEGSLTQEERRSRIASRALELRGEREKLRKEQATAQKEKAFRQGCSQLTEARSRALALQVAADRDAQLSEAAKLRQQQCAEEGYHSAVWEEERLKKEQRHMADIARQQQLQKELQESLAVQREALQCRRRETTEQERIEGLRFKEELQRGAAEDEAKERARRMRQFELGKQNKEDNIELESTKALEKARELEADKQHLNALLEKIKEDEEQEVEAKKRVRESAVAHMKAVEKQMQSAAGAETELDRLWQVEANKEWDKREARWRADQEKRDQLLKDVYAERGRQVAANREARERSRRTGEDEREQMIKDVEEKRREEREAAQGRLNRARGYQKCLSEQIQLKSEQDKAERQGKDLELIAFKLAEKQYQEKLSKEIQAIESQKPPQYSHMRVTSRRSF